MRKKLVPVLALAVTAAQSGNVGAQEGEANGADYLLPGALVAGAIAAVAALAGRSGGGGGSSSSGNPSAGRTLAYGSAAAFDTPEYEAQQGLAWVKAASLYYNGHYQWFTGAAPNPAAGTGIGIKVAIADTGVNAAEAATGGAIAIDAAASYDYVHGRAGSAADDFGHGTHVAGILASPKNGAGMHGLAYNATLVNFKVGDSTGNIVASDAQLADMIGRARAAGAMIINNSWTLAGSPVTSYSATELLSSVPRMIDASRTYVAAGGVVVFAAGNDALAHPGMQPGLPYRISGLEPGWMAVVAIDGSGRLASYSNRCGVAATWCLAAPGGSPASGLYSMYNDGGYAGMYGTSMAAPHVAGALAALKSMFVNLSYTQIRERLLYTANRSGAYADAATYGQGLMDLEAASSPVGGVSLPTGASASGAVAPASTSGVVLQSGAVAALHLQRWVLVVDNYQRAPFWVPSGTLFHEETPRLVERQWRSLAADLPAGEAARRTGLQLGATQRLGFSSGSGDAPLDAQLRLAHVPGLAAPAAESVALGYSADLGATRLGLLGTLPPAPTFTPATHAPGFGSRRALGAIAQHGGERTTYGVTLAMADHFERPIGIATSGAFAVDAGGALSSGAFVRRQLGAASTLEASWELARHRPQAEGLLGAPGFAVRTVRLGARSALGARTTLSASAERQWTRGEAAQLELPLTIDEHGELGRVSYALPYDELVGRTALTLRVDHELGKRLALRASLTHERYGFGVSVNGAAAMLKAAF